MKRNYMKSEKTDIHKKDMYEKEKCADNIWPTKIFTKRKKTQILMPQLCVDEQLTDRGRRKNSGKKGVASIDYIDQLLINFDQQNSFSLLAIFGIFTILKTFFCKNVALLAALIILTNF